MWGLEEVHEKPRSCSTTFLFCLTADNAGTGEGEEDANREDGRCEAEDDERQEEGATFVSCEEGSTGGFTKDEEEHEVESEEEHESEREEHESESEESRAKEEAREKGRGDKTEVGGSHSEDCR